MASSETRNITKFDPFTTKDAYYKEVNGVRIPVSVLYSKDAQGGKRPVMVRWHGGGLVTGRRDFAEG